MSLKSLIFQILIITCFSSCGALKLLNSGTANIKYRVSEARIEGNNYREVERFSNPSISVRNVQHPRKHGRWNVNFRMTPSFHYNDIDYESGGTIFNEAGNRVSLPNLNVKNLIGMGNAKLTLHTPIGAFALSLGFGGAISKLDNGSSLNTIQTREVRKIDLAWSAFFARRFFILAGPRYYKTDYEIFSFAFRLGFFWGKFNS